MAHPNPNPRPTALRHTRPKLHEWTTNIGELARTICTGRVSQNLNPSQSEIIVLGEFTLFYIREGGEIAFQKRVDVPVNVVVPYERVSTRDEGGNYNLLLGTQNSQLLVYKSFRTVWGAKVSFAPWAAAVGTFSGYVEFSL